MDSGLFVFVGVVLPIKYTGRELSRATDPAAQPSAASDSKVRQGYVEAANTSPTLEMSGLITAMRMFETNQKVTNRTATTIKRINMIRFKANGVPANAITSG